MVINRRAEDTRQAVAAINPAAVDTNLRDTAIKHRGGKVGFCGIKAVVINRRAEDTDKGSGYQSGHGRDRAINRGHGYQSPGHINRRGMDTNRRLSNGDTDTNLRDTAINRRGMDTNLRDTVIKRRDTATNRRGMDTNLRDTVIKRQPMRTTYWILPTKSLKFGRWGIKSFRTIFF